MKLGLGLSRQQLDLEHYRFARQCGCTHVALHLATGFVAQGGRLREVAPAAGHTGLAAADDPDDLWTYESLSRLTEEINAAELQVGAVDPLDFMSAALLKGAGKRRRMDRLKTIIRHVGNAGIPVASYRMALPGTEPGAPGRFARGDARTFGSSVPPALAASATRARASPNEPAAIRLREILEELLPVAEEAGVTLTAQVRQPDWYGKLIALSPSDHHAVEFSVADVATSLGDGVYSVLETCLRAKRLACLDVSNVRLDPPGPYTTFVDDGDVDILRIVRLLKQGGYGGMILPRRTPQMDCAAPWHAGMAHTLGFLKAALLASETAE